MNSLPFVALGGALGASLRYLVVLFGLRLSEGGFPWPVLSVNILGSFLMGCAVVLFARQELGAWAPFLMVGVLGGFTTFSAFSLDAYVLFEKGEVWAAALYVGLSVGLSILGLALGVSVTRGLLA
jgi:CrcB protein